MNLIKVNWVYIIIEHMLKSKRLADYRFPYVILVSKLIDYFGVDTSNERNETIKAVNEIDNATLIKMGFHKEEGLYWFTLNPELHPFFPETTRESTKQSTLDYLQHNQRSDLDPLKRHTPFGPAQQH